MAKLSSKQIHGEVRQILDQHPGGLRWAEVLKLIAAAHPETPWNTLRGAAHALFQSGDGIGKIARGTYQRAKYAEAEAADAVAQDEAVAAMPVPIDTPDRGAASVSEQDFYASFAEWLEENDGVTVAGALGGSSWAANGARPMSSAC